MERDHSMSEESWIVEEAAAVEGRLNQEVDLLAEGGWEEIIFMLEEILRA